MSSVIQIYIYPVLCLTVQQIFVQKKQHNPWNYKSKLYEFYNNSTNTFTPNKFMLNSDWYIM